MSVSLWLRRLVMGVAVGVLLAGGSVVPASSAAAAGYPSYAACDRAGRAGVQAGYWQFYRCVPYNGGWELLPE
jgi:hypothetical protein